MAITAFLSRSPGLLNQGPGGPASLGYGPHSSIFSPTDLNSNCNCSIGSLRAPSARCWFSQPHLLQLTRTSCRRGYIIVRRPLFFLRASQFRTQFNPSTVKVISWYSSTGWTCYLHSCVSYFDSLVGSEVNIQQLHMDEQRQDDQLEPTYSISVPIREVALNTCRKQWTIEKGGKKGSGISVLMARHDDKYIYI